MPILYPNLYYARKVRNALKLNQKISQMADVSQDERTADTLRVWGNIWIDQFLLRVVYTIMNFRN